MAEAARAPALIVLNEEDAGDPARYPDAPHVVISITEISFPGPSRHAPIPDHPRRAALLRVHFDDVDSAGDRAITRDVARRILAFAHAWRGRAEAFVIHCAAGSSRSPAVAAALAAHWGGDPEPYFYGNGPHAANRFVFGVLMDAAAHDDWSAEESWFHVC